MQAARDRMLFVLNFCIQFRTKKVGMYSWERKQLSSCYGYSKVFITFLSQVQVFESTCESLSWEPEC